MQLCRASHESLSLLHSSAFSSRPCQGPFHARYFVYMESSSSVLLWLISPRPVAPRFIRVAVSSRISLLLKDESYSMNFMVQSRIHSSARGHWGCLPLCAVSYAALSLSVQTPPCGSACDSPGYIPQSGIPGSEREFYFEFFEELPCYFPEQSYHLMFPRAAHKAFGFHILAQFSPVYSDIRLRFRWALPS